MKCNLRRVRRKNRRFGKSSAWSLAAGAKDLDKCASFYTDGALVLPINAPIATGKDQIGAVWSQFVSNPDISFGWRPTKIEVAQSSDIAYEIGTFDLTVAVQRGKSSGSRGKYVIVWKKQPNGEWKAAADIFNTDKWQPRLRVIACLATDLSQLWIKPKQ